MKRKIIATAVILTLMLSTTKILARVINTYSYLDNPNYNSQIFIDLNAVNCSIAQNVQIRTIADDYNTFYLTKGGKYQIIGISGGLIYVHNTPSTTYHDQYPNYPTGTIYKDASTGFCRIKIPNYNIDSFVKKKFD